MKTTEKMLAVMTAYVEGKKIEYMRRDGGCPTEWETCINPVWNWGTCNYRVKSEPKYRPYKDAEECFADVKKHGGWVRRIEVGAYSAITGIGERGCFTGGFCFYRELYADYVWADDGSPCGVLEEE